MVLDNEQLFRYVEKRAKYNVKDKKLFKNTDILKEAFCLSEERAYEILKDIMARKAIKNTKEAVIEEYMNMLGDGYSSLREQVELFGGNKLPAIIKEAERRMKKFKDGSIIDIFRDVYDISEEEIVPTMVKYMGFLKSNEFSFRVNENSFYKFLEENFDELDKQADRYFL